MEAIFKGENIFEFMERFDSDETCRKFIADKKWETGFIQTKRIKIIV
jgi:hypothetical protein